MLDDTYFMKQALIEAGKAAERGEVPVGAVVVCKERIIARAHNLTETLNDVTAHAEMQAITAAANVLGGKYLSCLLYTSDAADDMQCVDLGGRRIIKKNFFKQKTAYEISECLVGSEMCIRDSPCPIGIPKGAPHEELAQLLYDFILDPEGGQAILTLSLIHI